MESALLTIHPISVETRLSKLGWTLPEMHEIVACSVRARRGVSPAHPLGTAGYYAWSEASAMMRMMGAEKGFYISNENHITSTYSDRHRAKFAVCNTDAGTGREDDLPQNRNKKGPGTEQDIAGNQAKFGFYTGVEDFRQPRPSLRGIAMWYLCIFCYADDIRAELSCPVECESGYFTSFYERLNLTGNGFGTDPIGTRKTDPTDGDSGFDITVNRKQG